MQASKQLTTLLPVISLLIAATLWGIFWIPLRWLEGLGLEGLSATFLIYSGTLLVCIPIVVRHHQDWRRRPGLIFAIMLCSGWCNTAFILAILNGEILRVILLFYLSPVWSTLLARWVLREQLDRQAYLTLLIAVIGALLILWHPEIGLPWPQSSADWLALSSGFAFALANMFIRMASNIHINTKTVASWLGVILVAGVALVVTGTGMGWAGTPGVIYAVLTGLILMTLMTFAVVYGVTHMPIHRSAVILLFEVVAAAISSYLLTDERLGVREIIGGLIVVVAAYLAGTRSHHDKPAIG